MMCYMIDLNLLNRRVVESSDLLGDSYIRQPVRQSPILPINNPKTCNRVSFSLGRVVIRQKSSRDRADASDRRPISCGEADVGDDHKMSPRNSNPHMMCLPTHE